MRDFAKQVKRIEDCYTGGGIYCYKIEMKDGRFAIGATLCDIIFVDADPFKVDDDILYDGMDWMDEHDIGIVEVDADDYWDADDVWEELKTKYNPTSDGWDGYGERIVTQ